MRPAIGGEKAVLSPQSSIFNPQSSVLSPQKFSQKLDLRHFSRKCRENLNIRTLRIKFRNKSGFEDSPKLVPACIIMMIVMIITIGMIMTMLLMIMTASFEVRFHHLLCSVKASLKLDFIFKV